MGVSVGFSVCLCEHCVNHLWVCGVMHTCCIHSGSKCSQDQKSSKIVPIAVGAALAGLVIVVLIAYLIGRFRSRKQNSYEALS